MDNRPSLLKLLEDCEHGLIDYVVTKSVSRLARNTADFLTIVRKLLDLNVCIYFEKENIDTGSMENELMLSIMSSIAESESVSISENNKWSAQRRFSNGTFKCSYPPYGYDWDKEKGEMIVNEDQAEVVRFIFAQTLAGVGTHDIAKMLAAKGIPTKRGGKWTGHTVNGIIRNEKYTGDCLMQKTYTDDSFVRHRNLGEKGYLSGLSLQTAADKAGIMVTHCQAKRMMQNKKYLGTDYYPAILTNELMDQVKAEIERRASSLGREFTPKVRERKRPVTDECDQRCKHCYIFSGEGCKELKSMTWEQMQETVANCEDFCKVYHRKMIWIRLLLSHLEIRCLKQRQGYI